MTEAIAPNVSPSVRSGRRFRHGDWAWVGVAVAGAVGIAVVDPRTALTIVTVLAVFALALERLDVGLGVLVATVPIQDAWPATVSSHPLTWTRAALFAVASAWLVRLLLGRERIVVNRLGWWFAAYCLALVLSMVEARSLGDWAQETYRWLVALLVYAIALSVFRRRTDATAMWIGLVTGIWLSAIVAVDQVITGAGPASFAYRGLLRAYGLFGEPNPFAAYLELATLPLIAISAVIVAHRPFFRWTLFATAMLFAGAIGAVILALTQSRGGGLGFAAGLAVIAWYAWPNGGRRLVVAAAAIAVLLVWLPPARPVRELFGIDALLHSGPVLVTTANFATQERLAHWGAALRMWEHSPLLGIGAGNFNERYREYTPVWRFRIPRGHAHSAYLQAAAQAGAVGFVCYAGLMLSALRQCRRAVLATAGSSAAGPAIGAFAVTVAVAVHGIFDYVHVLSLGIVLSVLWGIANEEKLGASERRGMR
jgi:O-antigen ligase